MIASLMTGETDELELARLMVGREVTISRQEREATAGEPLLIVRDLEVAADHGRKALDSLSLTVHEGEIVGVAALRATGRRSWRRY